jgi:UDP-N-acetylmuramoyl-tripeptide--D-alanyl-D-alanine ligase
MKYTTIEELFKVFKSHQGVTTDTRKINKGDIFFALKGPNFDANLFALEALNAGAAFAVVDNPALPSHPNLLLVADVLSALQQLAGFYRKQLNIPIIAITGSNGKTTTKELVHAVLSKKYRTSTTVGNLNNHIGVPLTLLRIPENAEIAVIEMGANHQKEIEGYCYYTLPTHGLITNCGKAHLEGFGGLAGVRKGKGELFDHLKNYNGMAFVCSDFTYFHQMASERQLTKLAWYGTGENEAITGHASSNGTFLKVEISHGFLQPFSISTHLVGDYNLYNVLSAVAIGKQFGVSALQIKEAVESYRPDNSRSQLIQFEGNSVVLDAYNANPTSMAAAIRNFAGLKADKKILMLGAMAELGEESVQEHQGIVDLIGEFNWEMVVLVGGDFMKTNHPFLFIKNSAEAALWWRINKTSHATILLKGSRSMAMEKVLGL